ncbi:ER membrane glycoprotein subunit of the GPI transamidase complex-like protein [Conoideocrella luteorostrata]|uniref:GPI mannosyltransferase 2 n=1 Tax=Conoideocrella luteorostrata TaxID=1105319 RepID=A0AAJ0D0F6_9HYPO|nr:ER membrane glycoprotein subunit of the GPI transamidase complex-like protein [Conoideocrella luteorostrata]
MEQLFSPSRPTHSLTALFVTWKGFLLAIALAAALAPDYDTSTSLFFERVYSGNTTVPILAARLTRWDALYFMHSTKNGYIYEQEWAFGLGLPTAIAAISKPLSALTPANYALEPIVGIILAHLSHFIAVLSLHRLTVLLSDNSKLAFLSAALHIISPAGLFLSAPYNESPFACLSFIGNLLFAVGLQSKRGRVAQQVAVITSGVFFGLATTFRSNGLASGLLFAVEVVNGLRLFASSARLGPLFSVAAPVLGGLCVAAGSVVPQTLAWMRYCRLTDAGAGAGAGADGVSASRPWCDNMVPSIYTFVQDHYWNVGFLRYWTLNQVPLFLLASPMLAILITSGVAFATNPQAIIPTGVTKGSSTGNEASLTMFVRALSGSQAVVAALALTTYHVQIITRISSGYPVWYWWVASCLMDKKRQRFGAGIVVFMVMYAGIQGGLFASFLPPA